LPDRKGDDASAVGADLQPCGAGAGIEDHAVLAHLVLAPVGAHDVRRLAGDDRRDGRADRSKRTGAVRERLNALRAPVARRCAVPDRILGLTFSADDDVSALTELSPPGRAEVVV